MNGRPHRMRVRGGIPAWLLRVLLVVIGGVLVVAVNPFVMWQAVGTAGLLVGAVLPRTLASWVAVASIALGVLLTDPAPVRIALAVLAVHLVHVLAALTLVVPAGGVLAPRALSSTLGRLVVVQAIAQPLAAMLGVLGGAGLTPTAWVAPVGALILAASTVAVHRLRRGEDRA